MEKKDFYSNAVVNLYATSCTHKGGIDSIQLIENGAFRDSTEQERTDIDIEAGVLLLAWDGLAYQRLRAPEYPTLQEQFDLLYWDFVNGTKEFEKAIKAIKDKYPKPE